MTQTLARMERPLNNSSADPKRGVPTVILNGAHPFCHSSLRSESRASACKAAMALDEPSGFFAEFILNAAEGPRMTSSMGLGHKLSKGLHGRDAPLGSQNDRLPALNFAPIRHTREGGYPGVLRGVCPEFCLRKSDSFPIFLIFWAPFSLAALYIMLKRFPSQAHRHLTPDNPFFDIPKSTYAKW